MSKQSSPSVALSVDGLKKHFTEGDTLLRRLRPDQTVQNVRAVDGVNLTVERGDTVGLVGESGCGKSTLARAALRLLVPTEGNVYFNGDDITEFSQSELRAFRSEAQMIFQDPFTSLNPRYTVRDTLVEPMKIHDIGDSDEEREERARSLLNRVGLGPEHLDRYPHEFSGGQRQRVAIARALSVEPEIIVADEPVSALDVSVQAKIINLIEELKRDMGLTMLFISHDLSVVRQVCDRVAVMYLGEIVEEAATSDLFTNPNHPYTEVLISSIPVPDPTVDRDRIQLEGDVPTPINPPSGCRFHPRCPKVIPPEDWTHDQASWRRVLHLKTRIEREEIKPDAMRDQLTSETTGEVNDKAIVDALYNEHITEGGIQHQDLTLPDSVSENVREALRNLVEGNRSAAYGCLDKYETVCEEVIPRHIENDDRVVACHLHDPEVSASAAEE